MNENINTQIEVKNMILSREVRERLLGRPDIRTQIALFTRLHPVTVARLVNTNPVNSTLTKVSNVELIAKLLEVDPETVLIAA